MSTRIDEETHKVLTDADELKNMLGSRGWGIAKAKLDAVILDLQNISNIDMSKPETLSIQLAARIQASRELFNWVQDLYTTVTQAEANSDSLKDKPSENDFIVREGK